jgi:hypothetical protein
MPKWNVYAERRYSTAVEIEAPTYEAALAQFGDHEPSETEHERMDSAGEWEPLTVEDEKGQEVWTHESVTVRTADGAETTVATNVPMSVTSAAQREMIVQGMREMGLTIRRMSELLGEAYRQAASNLPRLQLPGSLTNVIDGDVPESFAPAGHHDRCLCRHCLDNFGNRRPRRSRA